MIRKLFSLVLPVALTAVVLLGACPECQPSEMPDHSCCDPASQPAPAKHCPDRNEILRNFDKPQVTDASVSFVAVGPAPDLESSPAATLAPAIEVLPHSDGPPDLFLRNSAILI